MTYSFGSDNFSAFSTSPSGPYTRGGCRIVSTATQGILPKHFEDFHDCNPSGFTPVLWGVGKGWGIRMVGVWSDHPENAISATIRPQSLSRSSFQSPRHVDFEIVEILY